MRPVNVNKSRFMLFSMFVQISIDIMARKSPNTTMADMALVDEEVVGPNSQSSAPHDDDIGLSSDPESHLSAPQTGEQSTSRVANDKVTKPLSNHPECVDDKSNHRPLDRARSGK